MTYFDVTKIHCLSVLIRCNDSDYFAKFIYPRII